MTSKAEKLASKYLKLALKAVAAGGFIPESHELSEALSALEYYIPEILRQKYRFWEGESLDGIFPRQSLKISDHEIELKGMCVLISDQTLTPIHLYIKVNETNDSIACCKCKLGEGTSDGLLRIPFESTKWHDYMYTKDYDANDWVYKVDFPV